MAAAPAPCRRGDWEAVAAVATGAVHVALSEFAGSMAAFMGIALVGWGVYVALRVRRDHAILSEWGVPAGNSGPAFRAAGAVFVVAAAGLAIAGWRLGHLTLTPGLALLLVVYPFWAFVEQFLLQAMLARNLAARFHPALVTVACALLFAADHLPDLPLAAAVLALALVWTPLYLRFRRLLPLALFHGWLGAMFYVWVLGRDPLREIFHLG